MVFATLKGSYVEVCVFWDDPPPTHSDLIRPGIPGHPPTPYWLVLHCCEAMVTDLPPPSEPLRPPLCCFEFVKAFLLK